MRKGPPAVLVGCGVGDALGLPFETLGNEVHKDLADWNGEFRSCRRLNLPPGHYSDDTEMAVCLAESLIERDGRYDRALTQDKYLAWSKATPHGMGGTVRAAMERLAIGNRDSGIAAADPHKVGSGTAMRIAPLGYLSVGLINRYAIDDASITHMNGEAKFAALAVALVVDLYLQDPATPPEQILRTLSTCFYPDSLLMKKLRIIRDVGFDDKRTHDAMGNTGTADQIVGSALLFALPAKSYEEGVIKAVCAGGDCDTRAAIVGAFLGARFGLEGIPEPYRKNVLNYELLADLDRKLFAIRKRLLHLEA